MRQEIAALKEKLRPLEMRYASEKKRLEDIRGLQKKKEELEQKLQLAEMRQDLAMAADIKQALNPPLHTSLITIFPPFFTTLPGVERTLRKRNILGGS